MDSQLRESLRLAFNRSLEKKDELSMNIINTRLKLAGVELKFKPVDENSELYKKQKNTSHRVFLEK